MSYYFDNKNIFAGPSVRQQDSHMIMEGVSKPLKEKIKYEAMELNFLKKTSRAKLIF